MMRKWLFSWKQWLSWSALIVAMISLTIIAYSWSRTRDLLRGPKLTVTTPEIVSLTSKPLITITGQVKRVSHLRLNDGQIFADDNGDFREELLLYPGYNIIKLEATDRFGRRVAHFLKLVYQDKA